MQSQYNHQVKLYKKWTLHLFSHLLLKAQQFISKPWDSTIWVIHKQMVGHALIWPQRETAVQKKKKKHPTQKLQEDETHFKFHTLQSDNPEWKALQLICLVHHLCSGDVIITGSLKLTSSTLSFLLGKQIHSRDMWRRKTETWAV